MNSKNRLAASLEGKQIDKPVCAVYDAFTVDDRVDWISLYAKELLVIDHVEIIETAYPNLNIREELSIEGNHERRDVFWETDCGTLHEYYLRDLNNHLLPWRMENFVKEDSDYRIMYRALEGAKHSICQPKHLFIDPAKENIGADSIYPIVSMDRTPLQKVQIDFAGLDKFAVDLAFQKPELMKLIDQMNNQLYEKFNLVKNSEYTDLKLWENLTIDVLGPDIYREHLVPVYKRLNSILSNREKRLHVHYDGKMDLIKNDIAEMGFAGIDSFSAGPEGDVSINDAVSTWNNTFLWINPSSDWYSENTKTLKEKINSICSSIKTSRFCFVISEDVPPYPNESIGAILDALSAIS